MSVVANGENKMNNQLTVNENNLVNVEQNHCNAKHEHPEPELDRMSEFERARSVSKTWSMGQD